MALEVDSLNDLDVPNFKPLKSDSHLLLEEREDQKTIQKMQSILNSLSFERPFSTKSLADREIAAGGINADYLRAVDSELEKANKNPSDITAITNEMVELEEDPVAPKYMQEIETALEGLKTCDETSYIIKVQMIVGKILAQFIRISEKERTQKEEHKGKYTKSNKEWGNLQVEQGNRMFKYTLLSFGLSALQFLAPKPDRELISFFAQRGCDNLAQMFNSNTQSKQKMVDSIGQLAYSEIQMMMNKGSTENKQEFINLLDKVLDSLKRAAQSG